MNEGMTILCRKRCIIGEGPIWNEREQLLYFVNGYENEICIANIDSGELSVNKLPPPKTGVAAIAFGKNGDIIVSRSDGVFILRGNEYIPLYDRDKYKLLYCNDMKVGPDGRLYVGTLSEKKRGVSEKKDGKLYSIDKSGNVKQLLDGLIVSNGMDWSADGSRFYHTDSDTNIIKEYMFLPDRTDIKPTGRELSVPGVDGFTIGADDRIYAACWGKGHIAIADIESMKIVGYIDVPARIPASCAFAGRDMDSLAVTTATYGISESEQDKDGMTFICTPGDKGRLPYLFDTDKM